MDFVFAAIWFAAGFATWFTLMAIIANHDAY